MLRAGAIFIAAIFLIASSANSALQPQQQTVGVQTNQQTHGPGQTTKNAKKPEKGAPEVTSVQRINRPIYAAKKCDDECQRRAEERFEYWTILGHRLKITDFLLAVFTFLLFIVGSFQGDILIWQTWLARLEFISSNRPRLKIRAPYLTLGESPDDDDFPIIRWTIINTGNSDAIIAEVRAGTMMINDEIRPVPAPYSFNPSEAVVTIPAGTFCEISTHVHDRKWAESPLRDIGMELYFLGRIIYRDSTNRMYAVGFGRRWEQDSRRLRPVDDPEYEYEE